MANYSKLKLFASSNLDDDPSVTYRRFSLPDKSADKRGTSVYPS